MTLLYFFSILLIHNNSLTSHYSSLTAVMKLTLTGETLETEQTRGGTYLGRDQMDSPPWQRTLELEVGNSRAKLYGGAQYHRALREFTVAVRHMKSPRVTEDEIHNAAGMGDTHNGVNFMRAACIIAMEKAQDSFDPVLESLRQRTVHVMKRLYPIGKYSKEGYK